MPMPSTVDRSDNRRRVSRWTNINGPGGAFYIVFKMMFLARPEGESCIINTATTDNAAQKHYFECASQAGFIPNPVAATIFVGMVLIILVYSALERSGTLYHLGRFGPVLPLFIILWLMYGIYRGLKWLKRHVASIQPKGPLFLRSLMDQCLDQTCGRLDMRLHTPEISSSMILDEILQDKMLHICATDCLRFSEIRRQIEGAHLKGSENLQLAYLFMTPVAYHKQPLPDGIRQISDMVIRARRDLRKLLERLKDAHQHLCTAGGDILTLLPPDPKKVDKLRTTYRYRPPTPERAQRMAFALETLAYLKAIRYENVNPMDRRRYESVATRVVPKLAEGLRVYKQAWQDLVDAYERPPGERPPS